MAILLEFFLPGILEKTVIRAANRDSPTFLAMPFDTNKRWKAVLQQEGREVNVTDPGKSIASASILNSGNCMLSRGRVWIRCSFPQPTLQKRFSPLLQQLNMMFSKESRKNIVEEPAVPAMQQTF
ncbi:G-type lectin S-receptor-like serine threonine-kinase LECRK3 [Olea europaea subsp. europaea]|uniref:G-type lectin S-receptor-like serine threonine-kinase LECRK3 n=1 Tax=Olea europaea subsp. europaea TaxID=158383 RepID=A0A8S0R3B1_OLEEU|nr:G-type lectin S-receptor-like serine threonine-kinase LECRK3 [Olea europaea subsp. europaea]